MMAIRNFFRTYLWESSGLLLLLLVVFRNIFPEGYIILGGDILQPIRMAENFITIHYDAFGRASLFYGIFYVLDKFSVSETAQISWYLGIFLIGSYISFLAFCAILFPASARVVRTLSALFYATNLYTLYVFTATWGYTSYQIIYIFIPALTGLYIKSIKNGAAVFIWSFFLVVFLASSSFGNPAFALSSGIYFLLLTIMLFCFHLVSPNKDTLKRIILLLLGSLLLNAYWILPLLPQVRSGVQEVFTSEVVNLTERLQKTSNAIFDTIRLMPTSEQSRYFPVNFPYFSLLWMKKIIVVLAFIPFFLVLIGFFQKRTQGEWRWYGMLFTLLLIFIALVARVRAPFELMNNFLFQLPGFNTLRGWDKLATFTPFLLSSLLFLLLIGVYGKKYSKFVLLGFLLLTVTLTLPFYAGGIQTKMSYILSTQKRKDFREAKQSAIVKIPDPYYSAAPVFQSDHGDYKLSMLPFSPGSSIGRVDFPIWKVNGPHPARFLYSKPYIELTEPYVPGWKFAEDFEKQQYDPQWITDLYGLIGVKYVFYHKDAKLKSVEKMEESRKYLEGLGAMKRVTDNEFFTLYQIDEKRVFPYVYLTNKQDVFLKSGPEGFSERVGGLREEVSSLNYKRQNPKEIVVSVEKLNGQSHIFLNEKYDSLWRAEYVSHDGKRVELERDEDVQYANSWRVKNDLSEGNIKMYYSPLRLFYAGQWVSGIMLLVVLAGTVSVLRKK
jgi:hypothetical protein